MESSRIPLMVTVYEFYIYTQSYISRVVTVLNIYNVILTPSFTPYQTYIFLKIIFKIRNQHKIPRKKVGTKFYFLSKPPKITFRTPKLQTLIKPVWNIFDRRDPKKTPLNWSFPTKWYPCLDISLFCYSCAVHNNLA